MSILQKVKAKAVSNQINTFKFVLNLDCEFQINTLKIVLNAHFHLKALHLKAFKGLSVAGQSVAEFLGIN